MENRHCVYMLRCNDQSLYTGYTNNLSARLEKHQSGKGAKYTRGRRPLVLEAFQTYQSKEEAMQQEYRIKQMTKEKKEQWILQWKKEGVCDEGSEKF